MLRPTTDIASMARVIVAAFFGSQHISWVQNNREDLTDRVQEIIDIIIPRHA
jgi:hypothetical protein